MSNVPDASLIVESGVQGVTSIPLKAPDSVLGSSQDANVVVDNPYVSRMHARIVAREGGFHISDEGSRNGTFVNGARVGREGRALRSGDRVELAEGQVVLRFRERDITLAVEVASEAPTGALVVDSGSRDVWVNGDLVDPPLTRKEFDVLDLLYGMNGKACSRDEIAETGWPERDDADVGDQEIDQCIRRLRLRIESDPSRPGHVITVRGYGYKLAVE